MENETATITTSDGLRLARQRAVVLRLALRSLPVDQVGDVLDELVALAAAADDLLHVLSLTADIHARSALQLEFRHGYAGLLVAGPTTDEEIH